MNLGPVGPSERTVRTAYLSVLMTVHNFSIQNSSDNLPSYLQTTIIAQMLSIGGEGVNTWQIVISRSQLIHHLYADDKRLPRVRLIGIAPVIETLRSAGYRV